MGKVWCHVSLFHRNITFVLKLPFPPLRRLKLFYYFFSENWNSAGHQWTCDIWIRWSCRTGQTAWKYCTIIMQNHEHCLLWAGKRYEDGTAITPPGFLPLPIFPVDTVWSWVSRLSLTWMEKTLLPRHVVDTHVIYQNSDGIGSDALHDKTGKNWI